MKLQRYRGIVRTPSTLPGLKPPAIAKPMPEPENVPEWVIHEDWALLQVIHLEELHWPVDIKLTTGVIILHYPVQALHSAVPFRKYLASGFDQISYVIVSVNYPPMFFTFNFPENKLRDFHMFFK
jgi:hypothetical protein